MSTCRITLFDTGSKASFFVSSRIKPLVFSKVGKGGGVGFKGDNKSSCGFNASAETRFGQGAGVDSKATVEITGTTCETLCELAAVAIIYKNFFVRNTFITISQNEKKHLHQVQSSNLCLPIYPYACIAFM